MEQFVMPTEQIDLPSKGKLYAPTSILSSGKVEMKYMGAKEEDILTNQNLIENGTVIDKLLESLTLNKINLKELYAGDKNAIMVGARILGYGKDYHFKHKGKSQVVDLSTLEPKPFDTSILSSNRTIKFTLPTSGVGIEFRLLNEIDEDLIREEIDGLRRLNPNIAAEVTTRLKHTLTSVDGNTDKMYIRNFVDNQILASDSRALRKYIKDISPDVDLTCAVQNDKGLKEDVIIPINLTFFWPDL